MSTPHNSAVMGQIAETVLLPGDPLRAKFIAENFLENVEQFNGVRNMFGFTGTYKGKKVSVMGTGMGCPSIGIYSYELIHMYGVKNLIRVGSCGAYHPDLNLYDIILAIGASTDSNYAGFSCLSKVIFIADMILGRLEIIPVIVLLYPAIWKRS
jgi:purine-nucleoside phosphorylase